jgi:Ca-activated chloride channel family protein
MRTIVLLFLCSGAFGQQLNVQKEIRFLALDKKGRVVSIAPGTQLAATVNDKYRSSPFEIRSSTAIPLRVGLVVDTSNSVQNSGVNSVVGSATRFLSARLHTGDAVLMISVKAEPDLIQDWTSDGEQLVQSVQKLRAGGGTALFDGVYWACKKLAAEHGSFRREVVVTSDGNDNMSHATLAEAERICFENGVAVYTINYQGSNNALGRGARVLEALAHTTGGLYFSPDSDKQIKQSIEQLSACWDAEYRGLATFPSLPEEKKIKDVSVSAVAGDSLPKFKAGMFFQAKQ